MKIIYVIFVFVSLKLKRYVSISIARLTQPVQPFNHIQNIKEYIAQLFHLSSMYCFMVKIRTRHPCAFSHENNAEQIYGFETLKWYEFILYYDHHF